jgi:hypothetical protein
MLFVTDYIQIMRSVSYQGSSRRFWRLLNRGKVIRTLNYADDLALPSKEQTVLQGIIDRLNGIRR